MQFLKKMMTRVLFSSLTLLILFIGLGIASFMMVIMLMASFFVKPQAQKTKWQCRKTVKFTRKSNIIEGQYDIV
ncbi:MAG: hypothetical protein ACWIPH_03360 [Ostreibacterium sp.]